MTADRNQILAVLSAAKAEIARRFGVHQLALFGSAARDELRPESDIDIMVDSEGDISYDAYFGLKDYLEALLGRPVDLVTHRGLKPRARHHVEQNLVRVA